MNDQILNIIQILFADIILSGDNALIIGMAASGLSPELRRKAFILGIALAAFFRIFFAIIATYLIEIPGILFFGGLLLYFVCWRFYKELRQTVRDSYKTDTDNQKLSTNENKKLINALLTITIADISMSIDNVLAVAAIAREDRVLLIFGLVLAIVFMAFFATIIMKILTKYKWVSWLGLLFLIYLSTEMVIDGFPGFYELLK
ncbi:MAG: YjbE family putative metal transport protein [Paracoccaceae bacterium]|tara:strand:- start:75 stop:683 length:609 start_codon:yes stop_codon:yes gene_type:complete